jgi:hypothetical protein
MPSRHLRSSTVRRVLRSERIASSGFITMRPCDFCTSRGVLCIVSDESEHCAQCLRSNRQCELAPPYRELERLDKVEERLMKEIAEADAKSLRLRKQRRLVQKKRQALSAREDQNIRELEIDELLSEVPAEEPLAPSSPSFSELLDPALLGSSGRSPSAPLRNG